MKKPAPKTIRTCSTTTFRWQTSRTSERRGFGGRGSGGKCSVTLLVRPCGSRRASRCPVNTRIPSMRYAQIFLCFALVPLATSAMAECLKANVEGQTAEGRLTVIRAQDAAGRTERPYILRLASNSCLDADAPDDAVKGTRTIHVFPADEKLQPLFHKLVGKTVVVHGNPFP